jgi:hypothetical protein
MDKKLMANDQLKNDSTGEGINVPGPPIHGVRCCMAVVDSEEHLSELLLPLVDVVMMMVKISYRGIHKHEV